MWDDQLKNKSASEIRCLRWMTLRWPYLDPRIQRKQRDPRRYPEEQHRGLPQSVSGPPSPDSPSLLGASSVVMKIVSVEKGNIDLVSDTGDDSGT